MIIPVNYYDKEAKTASVQLIDTKRDKKFYGFAACNPVDEDMANEFTGLEIATRRAQIEMYKDFKEETRIKLSILMHLQDCMEHSKKYNEKSYEATMLRRLIAAQESDLDIINNLIQMEKDDLSQFMKDKDEFYKGIRKLRQDKKDQ